MKRIPARSRAPISSVKTSTHQHAMFYTRLQVICDPEFSEILMAEMAEAGFDTFLETEKGFEAYAEKDRLNRPLIGNIQEKYKHVKPLLLRFDKVSTR